MNVPRSHAPFPLEFAFVLKLSADADIGRGAIRGRIEHVRSGRRCDFEDVAGLVRFLGGSLASCAGGARDDA